MRMCSSLNPGALVVYDDPLRLNSLRQDLEFYPVPFDKIVATVCPDAKLRKLVRNMIYVGVVARQLDIEMDEVEKAPAQAVREKSQGRGPELGRGAGRL